VTHTYLADGVGEHLDYIDGATLSCGQCHNEYYFAPETKKTTLPHESIDSMHPDAILNYFNTKVMGEDGLPFTDFTNKISGVRVIKVQHPELETYLSEGSVHRGTFTCADCHMGDMTKADGTTTKNHFLSNPTENEALIQSTCSKCHANLQADVKAIQEKTLARTRALADKLVELHNAIAEAAQSGKLSDAELDAVRSVTRDAQFYWDFVFVENSEGAHNSALTAYCQDQAEALMDQAFEMLK
jgi:nitrite reductase (cytochrome c-552)